MVAAYRERRISASDGLGLYVRDYGDPLSPRTPLLCLAGIARTCQDFDDLAPRHAATRRVICPDWRGRGRSDHDPDWRNYHPRVYIRDMLDILTALDVHRVVVIGTSMGGLMAMALAVARPGALAGVVLNDVGPVIDLAGISRIITYLRAHARQPDWDGAIEALKGYYRHRDVTTREQWLKLAQRTWREGTDGVLRYDFDLAIGRQFDTATDALENCWPLYRALGHVPTLAIRGGLSDILSETTFERMAEEKPDLVRLTVPGVGHAPLLDEPECESAIDDFLEPH